jgi:dihydroorotate dehydrogenase (fumarate)
MDLSVRYMGFHLPHPFMPGASPLVHDLDAVRRLEDAGASAIVMHSLFEEQIRAEQSAAQHLEGFKESYAEALTYFPGNEAFTLGPEEYIEHLGRVKQAVRIPVIASLNGVSLGGWLDYAKLMEEAGADGLELNEYSLPTDPRENCDTVEGRALLVLRALKDSVKIPVAVKLSPFYSSLSHFAHRLEESGADALVLFNRFYQPDINVETLDVERTLHLSDSSELLLRLRWLAILSGKIKPALAVSGGVHTSHDAIKAIMAGASAVQVVSAVLQKGPGVLKTMREETAAWLEKHEYDSLEQMKGSMNHARCPDPRGFERANYMQILQSWKV